jgi:hypothetical protein
MKKYLLLIILCLPLFNIYSQKKEVKYPANNPIISFSYPSDWAEINAGDMFVIMAKDTGAVIFFRQIPQANNCSDAVKIYNKEEEKSCKIEVNDEETEFEVNGIKFTQRTETLKRNRDGKEGVAIINYFIPDGKNKLVAIINASEEGDQKHSDTVLEIISSIKAVKK